ncbi:MAG: peptidylprolyl isomerase [Candidatus Omnitrophota bacterium]|nr:peptidylprolyl isomerase [Candidatus Omnitrophota bacterium]
MLKLFRHKNFVKIVLWGLLILILPAFVFWEMGSLSRSKKASACVGKINGKKVSFDEFANSITSVRCQVLLRYYNAPKVLNSLFKDKPFIGRLAWDRLIMLKEAKKCNMKAADKDVINHIRSHPIFLRDGKFDEKFYAYLLRNNIGLDPRKFEEQMRENIVINMLNESLTKDIKVTDEEIKESYKKENKKFKISYCLFPLRDFLDKAKVDDKEAADYYDEHKEEILLPAKEGDSNQAPRIASFDSAKDTIKRALSESKARGMALERAEKERGKIVELIKKDGESFEKAAEKFGIKAKETRIFTKSDYLEDVGDAALLAKTAADLNESEISSPVVTEMGALIFRVTGTEDYDEEKLKKEKTEYSKKILNNKKEKFLEKWLLELELKTTLDIDLKDYEKYYR